MTWRDTIQKGGRKVSEIFEQMNYGLNVQGIVETDDCKVMRLNDSSGDGTMTLYQVFPGVFLMYNDFHMKQCVSGFQTDMDLLCIDHCREGRIQQEAGAGAYSYLEAGDLRVDQRIHHNGKVTFPLCHYHGISIGFQMSIASKEIPAHMKDFSVDLYELQKKYCSDTKPFVIPGEPAIEKTIILELKLLADVGLVGFPNAGKSTLLSALSAARPKIADYPFTTMEPQLGIVSYRDNRSFVMADIPGIIEGASEGKGLGLRFLRHIERNAVLLFMVPADAEDITKEYEVLLSELEKFNPQLMDKQRVLAVSKSDMLDDELIAEIRPTLPTDIPCVFISAVTGMGLTELKDILWGAITDERNQIATPAITHRPLDGHHRVREEDEFIFEPEPGMPEEPEEEDLDEDFPEDWGDDWDYDINQ